MNCANHSDTAAVAFCRTCGKPLCNQCTRDVRGVIYCESCLAARMEGQASAAGFVAAGPTGLSADGGRVPDRTSVAATLGTESYSCRNSRRILSLRRGRRVRRAIRQGLGAPRHHGAADPRRECRCSLVPPHGPGDWDRFLLCLPDHRRSAKREGDPDGRARTRSIRAGAVVRYGREIRRDQSTHGSRCSNRPRRALPTAHGRAL